MHIALTGCIGSGKSYVCRLLEQRGVRVYDCDAAAKRLMRTDPVLQAALSAAVGAEVFPGGRLDKSLLARYIVASDDNAQRIDDIVHPAVAADYMASGIEWLESAILFESGFFRRVTFDYVVCVTAPLEVRLQRVMSRDGISREQALEWTRRQMAQDEKASHADFVVVNDGKADLSAQLDHLLDTLRPPKTNPRNPAPIENSTLRPFENSNPR